jgi:CheY-like chemotaxis protein
MKKKKILIVDDTEYFLQLEISYLDSHRFDIHTARSGAEALEKARTLKPDLILMDMFMQDINGDTVCSLLKKDPDTISIPVVIISSGGKESSKKKMVSAGANGIIFKPARKDQLNVMVEQLLGIYCRHWKRDAVTLPCTVILEDDESDGTIRSLSGGGAFIEWSLNLVPGDLCRLKFALPDKGKKIFIGSAVVVRTEELGETGLQGAGVSFLAIHPDDRVAVDDFINR